MKKNYAESLKQHLSKYREETLKLPEGTYNHKGVPHPHGHILQKQDQEFNILATIKASFWEYAGQPATSGGKPLISSLHRCFHHLNSSQGMCFNLFYPLIKEKQLGLISEILGIKISGELVATFEMESKIERVQNGERKTNFDFYLGWPVDNEILFEVKYTEREFGNAKKNREHRAKFQRVYKPLAVKASAFLTDECQEEDVFLDHYQLLRNLVHLSQNSHVVFVFASQNEKINQQATEAVKNFLTEAGRKRVRLVTVENLVAYFKSRNLVIDNWVKHWEKFEEKSLLSRLAFDDSDFTIVKTG